MLSKPENYLFFCLRIRRERTAVTQQTKTKTTINTMIRGKPVRKMNECDIEHTDEMGIISLSE